jgi:hypothetical protein
MQVDRRRAGAEETTGLTGVVAHLMLSGVRGRALGRVYMKDPCRGVPVIVLSPEGAVAVEQLDLYAVRECGG